MDANEFTRRAQACERKLFRIAYLMLRNAADCEDATQEALLRAWKHIASLREPAYFETWLVRILINECKRISTRRRPMADLACVSEANAGDDTVSIDTRRAITHLETRLREVFVLHYVGGYSVAEMSRMLSSPSGTVKWRLNRARNALRSELDRKENP